MNLEQLLNYGVATAFSFILLFFIIKIIYTNLKELSTQHKEIIQMGCHNQDIQKEHKEAMKEIVTSLRELNKK